MMGEMWADVMTIESSPVTLEDLSNRGPDLIPWTGSAIADADSAIGFRYQPCHAANCSMDPEADPGTMRHPMHWEWLEGSQHRC
jgi:hypothetical protein